MVSLLFSVTFCLHNHFFGGWTRKDWLNTSHVTTEVLDLYLNMAVTRETGHLTCWLFRNWVLGVLAENHKLKRIFKKKYSESTESFFFSFFIIDAVFCFGRVQGVAF